MIRTDTPTPCASDPRSWDLDQASPEQAVAAVAACGGCPVLDQCRKLLETEPTKPMSLIWAGQAFGDKGQPMVLAISGIRRAHTPRRHRKTTRRDAA